MRRTVVSTARQTVARPSPTARATAPVRIVMEHRARIALSMAGPGATSAAVHSPATVRARARAMARVSPSVAMAKAMLHEPVKAGAVLTRPAMVSSAAVKMRRETVKLAAAATRQHVMVNPVTAPTRRVTVMPAAVARHHVMVMLAALTRLPATVRQARMRRSPGATGRAVAVFLRKRRAAIAPRPVPLTSVARIAGATAAKVEAETRAERQSKVPHEYVHVVA